MADETIEIASDGDVLLVVTKAEHTCRFRVNSAALRMASQVFTTLLSPKFAEGQALATKSSSSCEINLHDDDPDCMKLILMVIHLQQNKLPQKLDAKEITSLATLVDKYLLHGAMKFILGRWLLATKDDDLHEFLKAALLVGHAEAFAEITRLMILHQRSSYSRKICAGQEVDFVHCICESAHTCSFSYVYQRLMLIIVRIEKKRDWIRTRIMHEVLSSRSAPGVGNQRSEKYMQQGCTHHQHLSDALLSNISRLAGLISDEVSLQYLFTEAVGMVDFGAAIPQSLRCIQRGHLHPEPFEIKQRFDKRMLELGKFKGLCLQCEREGTIKALEKICNHGEGT